MKRFSKRRSGGSVLALVSCILAGGCHPLSARGETAPCVPRPASGVVIEAPEGDRPPYRFSDADEVLLDEVQRGAFNFLWAHASPETGMAYDRSSADLVSVAGVGFQLSAIPIGVERGWVTREQGRERAQRILDSLLARDNARVHGLYFHFLDPHGDPHPEAYEHVVSTIDSALLFAGIITASSYFGGDVARVGDELLALADWRAFLATDVGHPAYERYVTLGWRADDTENPTASGSFLRATWADSGDEHRLVAFLGVAAPDPERRLDPEAYYALRRPLACEEGVGTFVWLPYSGALFTGFFAHCWIDYRAMGVDDPSAFGFEERARVDWWENSRRFVNLHRKHARENPEGFTTIGEHAWGLSACDGPDGYLVSQAFATPIDMPGSRTDWDLPPADHLKKDGDIWHGGVIAPYAAGSSIVFEPGAAIASLRHHRAVDAADNGVRLWEDPATGGWGFFDSYTLDTDSGEAWVAPDRVAIDQGPMILLIENARTGLVWDLFAAHPAVKDGMRRLRMDRAGG